MASAGTYRLNLAGRVRSQNLVLVKATIGRTTKAFPYVPAGFAAAPANVSPEFSAQAGAPLAKVPAAVVDTLRFTASGFAAKSVELNSADTTVNVTQEASGDIWGGLKNPPGKSAGCGKAATLTSGICIDTTRVFATGMSFGGMFTYSISTNHQKRFRAGVGLAPANYNIYLPNPKLKDPIAWMHTTGMGDGTTPWVNSEA